MRTFGKFSYLVIIALATVFHAAMASAKYEGHMSELTFWFWVLSVAVTVAGLFVGAMILFSKGENYG